MLWHFSDMTIYQVRRIVDDLDIQRFIVVAIDDVGEERQLMLCDTEEEAKACARAANLWWEVPTQVIKRMPKASRRRWH
jgi:hypothetical protein